MTMNSEIMWMQLKKQVSNQFKPENPSLWVSHRPRYISTSFRSPSEQWTHTDSGDVLKALLMARTPHRRFHFSHFISQLENMATCGPGNGPDMLIQSPSGQLRAGPFQRAVITKQLDNTSQPLHRDLGSPCLWVSNLRLGQECNS